MSDAKFLGGFDFVQKFPEGECINFHCDGFIGSRKEQFSSLEKFSNDHIHSIYNSTNLHVLKPATFIHVYNTEKESGLFIGF